MSKDDSKAVEELRRILLQPQPVMVFGSDFMAFNYGDSELAGGRDSVVTSQHGHARINRQTGVWSFWPEPNVRLSEATHFEAGRHEVGLGFLEIKREIEKQ